MNACFRDIIVVDDDGALCKSLSRILKAAGFRVRTAKDGKEALQTLEQECPYFVISDWRMSPVDGIELCRNIRMTALPHYVYVVLLSVSPDYNDVVTGLRAGADDFVGKPVHRRELLARLEAGARVLELECRLNHLASVDPLTGVLNRRMGLHILEKEWSRVVRYGHPLSCVMWDLDQFKPINDTYGHLVGDDVLRASAQFAEVVSRRSDYLFRWGGDKFLMIMPDTNEEGASCWAQRYSSRMADKEFCIRGHTIPITASFGVAERQDSMQNPEHILDAVDQAMYVAKRTGKQRIVAARSISISPPNSVAPLATAFSAHAAAARWPVGSPDRV
jgi:diguanylate cyclase (GGDEF)-like protein